MRFFVRMTERECVDAQEEAAMLRHRLDALAYHEEQLRAGTLAYGFFSIEARQAVTMWEVSAIERLDWLLKRGPFFPYTISTIEACIGTEALVREAQDYLGEEVFSEDELPGLNFPRKTVREDMEYWLAIKVVPPFSPLCPTEVQDDVHRRTVIAQRGHFADLEFADDNPAGRPIGILIAEGPLDQTKEHVRSCEVYPDTVVEYTRLLTHRQAWRATCDRIRVLRREPPSQSPFET